MPTHGTRVKRTGAHWEDRARTKSLDAPTTVVVRTERRSWITVAITGFGALLLRYLKTVRERGRTVRPR